MTKDIFILFMLHGADMHRTTPSSLHTSFANKTALQLFRQNKHCTQDEKDLRDELEKKLYYTSHFLVHGYSQTCIDDTSMGKHMDVTPIASIIVLYMCHLKKIT